MKMKITKRTNIHWLTPPQPNNALRAITPRPLPLRDWVLNNPFPDSPPNPKTPLLKNSKFCTEILKIYFENLIWKYFLRMFFENVFWKFNILKIFSIIWNWFNFYEYNIYKIRMLIIINDLININGEDQRTNNHWLTPSQPYYALRAITPRPLPLRDLVLNNPSPDSPQPQNPST